MGQEFYLDRCSLGSVVLCFPVALLFGLMIALLSEYMSFMLQDLDNTLKALLERHLPRGVSNDQYEISFDVPGDDVVVKQGVNLFLYDVRENLDLRNPIGGGERQTDGTVIRKRPSARVDCSYLITAWAPGSSAPNLREVALVEHRILGEVMQVLLRFSTLPTEVLQGSLRGQEPLVRTSPLRSGQLQGPGEFWQAIGSKPKAMLHYTVTISVPINEVVETAPLVLSQPLVQ